MLLFGFGYGYPMFYGFDRTYLLVLIAAIFSMWASARVNSTYSKYAKVRSMQGLTGAEAAQRILYHSISSAPSSFTANIESFIRD